MTGTLSQPQFDVLYALLRADAPLTQRQIQESTRMSLGGVNTAVRMCEAAGYIDKRRITQAGREALEPYRVDNAVIMAAGLAQRFAPISYERPKGALRVRGEGLIERQIEQLHAAGITDITVIVGYKKEYFFHLADRFGAKIVVNDDYVTRNNNGSLWWCESPWATPTCAPRTTTSRPTPSTPMSIRPTTRPSTSRGPLRSGASPPAPAGGSPA